MHFAIGFQRRVLKPLSSHTQHRFRFQEIVFLEDWNTGLLPGSFRGPGIMLVGNSVSVYTLVW